MNKFSFISLKGRPIEPEQRTSLENLNQWIIKRKLFAKSRASIVQVSMRKWHFELKSSSSPSIGINAIVWKPNISSAHFPYPSLIVWLLPGEPNSKQVQLLISRSAGLRDNCVLKRFSCGDQTADSRVLFSIFTSVGLCTHQLVTVFYWVWYYSAFSCHIIAHVQSSCGLYIYIYRYITFQQAGAENSIHCSSNFNYTIQLYCSPWDEVP